MTKGGSRGVIFSLGVSKFYPSFSVVCFWGIFEIGSMLVPVFVFTAEVFAGWGIGILGIACESIRNVGF